MDHTTISQPSALPGLASGQPQAYDASDGLMAEVKNLRAALATADRDQTAVLLRQLRALGGQALAQGRKGRRSAGVVQLAITQAEQQLEALSDESGRHKEGNARSIFEAVVYVAMSKQAKQFYDNIDKKTTYELAPVKDGMMVEAAKTEVDGEELREKFSMIKYHSMSETEKKDVLNKTFGMRYSEENMPSDPAKIKAERDGVLALHQALRDMEAYKAYLSLSQSKGHMRQVLVDISFDHDRFAHAHRQVDAMVNAYEQLLLEPGNGDAILRVREARLRLKLTLKDEVIDRLLLDNDGSPQSKAGDMVSPLTPILGKAPDLFRP